MSAPTLDLHTMPAARIVLPPDADREEWLAARRQGIGGSDAPIIMGAHRHGSEYRVWLDKTGRNRRTGQTEQMRRGNWLEAGVCDYFAERTGIEIARAGLAANVDQPWEMATVDRLTGDGGLLECKSVSNWADVRHEWTSGMLVARDAWVQLQWQLLVTGRAHGWLIAYVIDRAPLIRGPFDPDPDLQARMRERVAGWWAAHVLADVPPALDPSHLEPDEIVQRWPDVDKTKVATAEYPAMTRAMLAEREELAAAESAGRRAEKRRREIDAALCAMAAGAGALVDPETEAVLATFRDQQSGPRTEPGLAEDHPGIYADYVTRTTYRRVIPAKQEATR